MNYFLRIYARTTNTAKMMITIMCTGIILIGYLYTEFVHNDLNLVNKFRIDRSELVNYLFNSLMVCLASHLQLKYPIILEITEDRDLSSISAISFRKSSFSFVVLNDIKEVFFIVKTYNIV